MNRSFRGSETLMPSIRSRVPQLKSLQSSITAMREKEDDLALFYEMRKREKEKTDLLLLQDSDELDAPLVLQPGSSPLFDVSSAKPAKKTGHDDFLNSDGDKNDYDWLLTPPGTPLFPSLETESRKTYMSEFDDSKAQPTTLKSRLANSQTEPAAKSNLVSRQPNASTGLTSSVSGVRRPSSAGGPASRPATPGGGSRPATPTGRPTLTSSRSSRPSTPTSRATLSSSKSTVNSSPKPAASLTSSRNTTSITSTTTRSSSRSSTPSRSTARSSAPSSGPTRSSTPTRSTSRSSTPTRSTARSLTPTSRQAAPASRPTSRTSTPTRRPSTPSNIASATAALNKSSSSISSKSGSVPSKNPGTSRGASPTVRSRPWNPAEMPGFSLDAPPNLRTTILNRPLSATRGRPAASSARSASVEPPSDGRQRRQSCSPSRGRAPNGGIRHSGSSVPAVSRGHSKVNDDVSPVVMGTKMVDRVINMRRLAPPRQDHSPSLSGKSASSPDSSGFGRTLSKKSLDMAIRHMDIRRSIPGNLRPLMTKIPASSMYSVRSGSRTASISDSPIANSSNASSEQSVNNHIAGIDGHGSEMEDDLASDRGHCQASPTRMRCT